PWPIICLRVRSSLLTRFSPQASQYFPRVGSSQLTQRIDVLDTEIKRGRRRTASVLGLHHQRSGLHDVPARGALGHGALAAGGFSGPILCCGHPTASAFFCHSNFLVEWLRRISW